MNNRTGIDREIIKEAKSDLIKQIIAMLSALLPVLTLLGISLEWFTIEFISAFNVFLIALTPLAYNMFSIYKNHFSGSKAKTQKRVLKRYGLK